MNEKLKIERIVEKIAQEVLNISTLEERNSDSLDFYEVSVWGLQEALIKAYEEGNKNAIKDGLESYKWETK